MNVSSQSRNLEWVILWESHVLLKHVYLKSFFPTKVIVRKFSEKTGGMFLMEPVLYVFPGPVHIWWFLIHISGQVLLELYLKKVEIVESDIERILKDFFLLVNSVFAFIACSQVTNGKCALYSSEIFSKTV